MLYFLVITLSYVTMFLRDKTGQKVFISLLYLKDLQKLKYVHVVD